MMKNTAPLFLVLFALGNTTAAELQISATEPIMVVAPAGWENAPRGPVPFPTLRIASTGDRNAVCLISILDKNHAEFKDTELLKKILRGDSRPYVSSRGDLAKVEVKELPIPSGFGFYANFVDPDLVGKPVRKGSYKTATPIIVGIGSDYLIKATILCDDLQGRDYAEALEIVKSIQVAKPRA